MKANIFVEFNGKKVDEKELVEKAKEIWRLKGNKLKDLNSMELYFKPNENKCYYVFNGKGSDSDFFEI